MMKKLLTVLMAFVLVFTMTACGASSGKETATKDTAKDTTATEKPSKTAEEDKLSGKHHVEIKIKGYGMIKAELDADTAPITVTNFVKLAEEGFYDGLTFHRIIKGFMIQGGDPEGTGMGGSDENIKGEFSSNGVENNISHVRGTLSMARSTDNDSASSQFFIMHQDGTYLDGDYAAFGTVTEGIEIVDKICEDTPVTDGNGTVEAKNQPVITSIKVID